MDERDRIIASIGQREGQRLANKVRRKLQSMTEGMLSGDDTCLKNIWYEVCVQVQGGESFFWESYEDVIDRLIRSYVDKLTPDIRQAIWLQTDNGQSWSFDKDFDQKQLLRAEESVNTLVEACSLLRTTIVKLLEETPGSGAEILADPWPLIGPLYEARDEAERHRQEIQLEQEDLDQDDSDPEQDIIDHIRATVLGMADDWHNSRIEEYFKQTHELD
jgi:hypothetical protein